MKRFLSNTISPLPESAAFDMVSVVGIQKMRTPKNAARQFAEWASLFAGKIFVNLVVYADESGTHDRAGKLPGSEAPVFGGYMGDVRDWKLFCWHWQSVLDKYKVPYFHFREFGKVVKSRNDPKSPYYGWNDMQRDTFLFELAAVAGGQVPVGAMINLKDYVNQGETDYPFHYVFHTFFDNVEEMLRLHWPSNRDSVSFFLDKNDAEWIRCFRDVFKKRKIIEPRFSSFAFVDDERDPKHLPLQAADLISYRVRKGALKHMETRLKLEPCLLDHFLFRHRDPNIPRDITEYRKSAQRAASKSWEEKFSIRLPSRHQAALT